MSVENKTGTQGHGSSPQQHRFRAPGRVNLIGEHTDYNDGFVLPCAIEFYAHVSVEPREDGVLQLSSREFEQTFSFEVKALPSKKLGAWCDYVLGVANELSRAGVAITGANLRLHSNVPVGAGLSSSAAIEVASTLALLKLGGSSLPMKDIARLCQRAENNFVGAHVGIMDQFVSCNGKEGHAVLLDCRSLEFELVPIPRELKLIICNTMVKHELSGGEYNQRRAQCEEGVRILARSIPGIRALRDVSSAQLEQHRSEMPELVYRRCLHVVCEDERVMQAKECFSRSDFQGLGKLMKASHDSLRDLYEVSCSELDAMVEAAQDLPGFVGGRMTGGGFGGCTVNLVKSEAAADFAARIAHRYHAKVGITPDVFVCDAASGAGPESEP